MNLLAHASVGLTGAVSVEVRRVGFDVRDAIDRLTYPQESLAAALDCWRRLHEGYALAGEVVTVQRDSEPAEAHDARHAAALRLAVRRAQGARDAAQESDRLATATITALARSGKKCSEGYRGDGSYTAVVNGFIRTGVDPARVVLVAAMEAGLDDHPAVIALAQRLAVEHRGGCLVPARADVVPCGAGLDAYIEPVAGCTRGRVVATLRERASGRMAHPLAFAEGATRAEAVRAAVEALRAALANSNTTQETV